MPSKQQSKTSKAKKSNYTAPALEKGLDILELLAGEAEGLTLSDIASRLSRSVGEIFRMLVVLENRNYISSSPGADTFQLTLKLFELSHQITPIDQLTTAAFGKMRQLAHKVEQSCHLSIYTQGKAIVIAQESSPADRGLNVRMGAESDLIDSCSGHVLLAFSEDEERERMLEARAFYRQKESRPRTLKRRLEKVRKDGYESIGSMQVKGVTDVGCPILGHNGVILAALTMPFLEHIDGSHSVNLDQASNSIRETASEISERLGYNG